MKKILLSLSFVFCAINMVYAQIPVTDVAQNTTTVTNQIINGTTFANQLVQLRQQAEILTTTLKYVQEVASVVRDAAYAKNLIERQVRIVDNCQNLIERADKLDARLVLQLERNVMSFLSANTSLVTLITSTLTTRFKMNDSERLGNLMRLQAEQMALLRDLNTVNLILSTAMTTNSIIEYQIFR
ncbi:hypothetical protein [Bacteroides sp. 51]|uniref:hypothetical protein n=1 Tax=Bacteroides sp. 51 TaxID=2302938 RepID=UPI0013D0D483|nr:hypothetical protein [Bacteroides sp. 51]